MSKEKKQAIIKILFSIILFGVIFWQVDLASVWSSFRLLDLRFLPLLILLVVLNYLVSSVRWKVLLIHENSEKASVSYLTSLYFIGSFFNNFMPTSIGGDVFKIVSLGKRLKNKADAFAATFMERFTGIIALVLISYIGLVQTLGFWVAQLPDLIAANTVLVFLFKFVLFFGFWIAAFAGFLALRFLSGTIGAFKKVYDSLVVYKGSNKILVNAFLTSFIVQVLAIFTQYFIFSAMGVNIPLDYALFIFPVITLISFFVPSLNGLGVQDALYMQLFLVVGIPAEISLSASIIYHLLRLFVSLFGGVLYALGKSD